ncbi:MAG: THUMP domain-containing protein, partial [Tannerella sp.]|nr:THUMP domain-containing protein [Tannerella sp.]
MQEDNFELIAKTLYGLEDVLAEELTALNAKDVQTGRRMVSFTGDKAMLYKTNLHCRTALRILMPLAHFKASNADTVYTEVKKIEWDNYFSSNQTFTIDAVVNSESFNHSKFVAYRTKDAIVDYFNEKYGQRPSVRLNNPDMYIHVHISHQDCTVSLDSSGESLHKRGYRLAQGEAPLSEVLAAGMILLTGWRGESNFVDPMCGSGTLLIEAAMIALNIPPGLYRREYAFERWKDFDRELFDEVYQDESGEREFDFKCYGSDISPNAIAMAEQNIQNAGLSRYIELKTIPFQQFSEAPSPGILVTNPPYGERITSNDIVNLYAMIGERLKHVFTGYQAWILSYKEECFENIGLRPGRKIKLMNGSLDCEYRCYELFKGTNKEFKTELKEKKPDFQDAKPAFKADRGRKVDAAFAGRRSAKPSEFTAGKRTVKTSDFSAGKRSTKPSEFSTEKRSTKPYITGERSERRPPRDNAKSFVKGRRPSFESSAGKRTVKSAEFSVGKRTVKSTESFTGKRTTKPSEFSAVRRTSKPSEFSAGKRTAKTSDFSTGRPRSGFGVKTDRRNAKPALKTAMRNSTSQRPANSPKSTRKTIVKRPQSPR